MPKLSRAEVYALFDGERTYQDIVWPKPPDFDGCPVATYIVLLDDYLAEVKRRFSRTPGDAAALDSIRKLGGIVTQCLEFHGAQPRVIDSETVSRLEPSPGLPRCEASVPSTPD